MSKANNIDHHFFIKTSAALSGDFLLSFYLHASEKSTKVLNLRTSATFHPNAFIGIGTDDEVILVCNYSDIKQATYTSIDRLIANELDPE
jgi:hypothetical protein